MAENNAWPRLGTFSGGSNNVNAVNSFDPYYLSNADHPGMQLVAIQFNGLNFQSWYRNIRMALGAKTKLGFVNGSVPKPAEDTEEHFKWMRCDYMVMSWVINSMKSDIAENFMFVQSSKELWDEIRERFAESNAPLIYQLQRQLSYIRQENMSVSAYYSNLKKIWDELQALDGIPVCVCGGMDKCACAIWKKLLEREAVTRLVQFLMGLSDSFEHVRTSILSSDPLPSVNRAYQIVLQVERQKEITGNMIQTHDALAVQRPDRTKMMQGQSSGEKRDYKKAKLDRKCTFCNEKGHVKETCFKLIGYPDWYKGSNGKAPAKMAANVQDTCQFDNPMDERNPEASKYDYFPKFETRPDDNLVNAVFQEVLKRMKGKGPADGNASAGTQSSINFAGPFN